MTRQPVALGLLLLVAAAAVSMLVGVPALRERDRARAEYARARQERERLRARMAEAERSRTAGLSPAAGTAAARQLRSSLLAATRGLDVEEIRLHATVGDRQTASGELSAAGPTAEVLRLAERLSRPDSGVLLDSVKLTSDDASGELLLNVAGTAAGARP